MVADIDSPFPLSRLDIESFRANGFVKLAQVLSAETLAHYGSDITRLTLELNRQAEPLETRSTYDRAFLQIMNLWRHSGKVREFVLGKRLGRIAAGLLEVGGVRLYHDQSLYKEPGGGITPAHADQYYWPLASDRTVTAWIPLQAVPQEMGPLAFFAGSQSMEFGRELPISDEGERLITANMSASGFRMVDGPFDMGEVSFHLGWTFHRAGANRSSHPRSVMTVIYMDHAMQLKVPVNEMQRNDWETWCPGAVTGELIDTPLNPLVYLSDA